MDAEKAVVLDHVQFSLSLLRLVAQSDAGRLETLGHSGLQAASTVHEQTQTRLVRER